MRILAGPAGRGHTLWSKFIFCTGLGLSQMLVLLFIALWRFQRGDLFR